MSLEKVLITGGAGVVGSTITDQLVRAGAGEIVVFDNFGRGRPENLEWAIANGSVSLVSGDISDTEALRDAMEGCDVVFHQAAIRITQCAEEPRLAFDVMVAGTFNVAEAAVAAKVGKVVLASSAAVYGMAETFPTPELHHPWANRTLYGAAKAFDEMLFRTYNEMYDLDYVTLRYFNVYGPRMAIRGAHTEVLVRWMERIANGQAPLILGDGSQTVDFVYVDDVARANVLAATSAVTDDVFNVGSGEETSLRQLADTLLRVMGSDLQPEFGPERGVNPVPRRVADLTRSRAVLGFEPEVKLEDGLRRLVSWWRSERAKQDSEVPDQAVPDEAVPDEPVKVTAA
jgi:UDP-glucose 4-epimerase